MSEPLASGPLVKICGLVRAEDARHSAAAGADFLGAILSAGFPRSVAPEVARAFLRPGGSPLVAVLVDEESRSAAALAREAGASILQLHGDEPPGVLEELRNMGAWQLWKALRPRSLDELREGIARYASYVDAFLLDGWREGVPGGSGTRVPSDLAAVARDEIPEGLQLVVAGGLTPENVTETVTRVRPDVVDVSSGVETVPGRKDPARVEHFVRAARGAVAGLGAP